MAVDRQIVEAELEHWIGQLAGARRHFPRHRGERMLRQQQLGPGGGQLQRLQQGQRFGCPQRQRNERRQHDGGDSANQTM